MKLNALLIALSATQLLTAQTFNEVTSASFEGVTDGEIAFADVDGDTDLDLLITGLEFNPEAKLFLNDGSGNFLQATGVPFVGVYSSSVAFADVDGDNDQDVVITGAATGFVPTIKLYINDGSGNYTDAYAGMPSPLSPVIKGDIAFADVDGDNDQDLLVTGNNNGSVGTTLYLNDGAGMFTPVNGLAIMGINNSSIAFSDVDGDNDQDVVITGDLGPSYTKLYLNDGSGIFTEDTSVPFDNVHYGSIAFFDADGDNDDDLLITGENNSNVRIAKLYTNDGAGGFSLALNTPFDGVRTSSIDYSDIDGDNDLDVLITGRNSNEDRIAKLYTNDGTGTFTEVTGTSFQGVDQASIAFGDVYGQGHEDIFITGWTQTSG